ncbi:metal ABC transporter solute-binding protein, Zn/Mn family [Thermococcus stetteri]|uniref:metal ABC transporter solute-binding protein, Zn/Mn family n=1 Tax=Thermococcus stetteri TaxID=49900 RepID=UPI001AE19A98|nr:zinc ABC transporter substrate-binding protein [Thermococcus stetteri]MBP1910896.1 zinc/manganese transport system substrate-binding protein [Thermococcus stetteri]
MKREIIVLLLIGSLFFHPAMASGERPLVVATIGPLGSIVREAFPGVDVVVLIPPGVDPHDYQMTAEQVELVQRASVIVTTSGHLPVEKRMVELKENGEIAGRILLVDDYKKYGFRYLKEHWYNEKDNPHGVWLDPYNAIAIAEATEEALIQSDPARESEYRLQFETFKAKVLGIADSYKSFVHSNATAVIQMPPDQYALEWLGIKAVDALKPEEEVPAKGVDTLLGRAEGVDILVYGLDSPDQMKRAMMELADKSGRPLAGITVFWSSGNYTDWLVKNTAAVIEALNGKNVEVVPKETKRETEANTERYILLSLITGIVLGTALGVIIKK